MRDVLNMFCICEIISCLAAVCDALVVMVLCFVLL